MIIWFWTISLDCAFCGLNLLIHEFVCILSKNIFKIMYTFILYILFMINSISKKIIAIECINITND